MRRSVMYSIIRMWRLVRVQDHCKFQEGGDVQPEPGIMRYEGINQRPVSWVEHISQSQYHEKSARDSTMRDWKIQPEASTTRDAEKLR
jgi:hypothetical protein